jgi:uncharacterized protein YndB with AHSA1/START domain
MEAKTQVHAEDGKQELLITREFDLPVELLFRAYVEPELVEEWMGTKVIRLENKNLGCWQFETTDPKGNKHGFQGVIHTFENNRRIIRTFEMTNTPYPVQLEFIEFDSITADISKVTMRIVYRSVADRDNMLKLPFAQGINFAHNRIQQLLSPLK